MLSGLIDTLRTRRNGRSRVLIFDLDGTLMDNRPRVVGILHEMSLAWRAHHPEASERLASADVDGMTYTLEDNLRLLGIDDAGLLEAGFAFWKERFFTDGYLHHDVAVPGAVDFARRCHDAGANLVYLTGRDLPNMAIGTFASLRDLGFPIGVVGTELVTKPSFDLPDEEFKNGVAAELARLGEVLAVFDNEPANCNILLDHYPSSASVLVDTLYAPDPPELHPDVSVIDSFEM
jgi:phosphoglycolate phosphatase-like HAD superfamily hydrolase